MWSEAWLQCKLVLPVAGANVLQRLGTWVTWVAVGRLGKAPGRNGAARAFRAVARRSWAP